MEFQTGTNSHLSPPAEETQNRSQENKGKIWTYFVCIKALQQVQEGLPVVGRLLVTFEDLTDTVSMVSPQSWERMRKVGHGTGKGQHKGW